MILLAALSVALLQATPDSITIDRALQLARAHRAVLEVAGADLARARASVRVAGQVPNPVGGYSYTEDTPRQHVSLEQSLEWLLTRSADRAAARAELGRVQVDSAQAAADLAAEVRVTFYGAIAARELELLTRDQSVLADSLVTIARIRFTQGDIPLLEQEQLRLEAIRATQRHGRAIEAAAVAHSKVIQVLAQPSLDAMALHGTLAEGLSSASFTSTSQASPRVRGAEYDSAAASLRLRGARRAGVPLPTLQVGADWDDPGVTSTPLAVVGFSIPLPLWHHGAGAAAVVRAEAERSNAMLRETRNDEQHRLAETEIRLRHAEARALVARDSLLPLARQVRSRATAAYQAGALALTPVLDALRAERDIAAEVTNDLLAWQEARAAWNQARGLDQ